MKKLILYSMTLALVFGLRAARAEVSQVNIVSTIGLAQFPGRVAYEQKFIQKRAAALGIPDLQVNFQEVTSGTIVSDLILAGRADVGIGGIVPLFNLWAKTRGQIKGMMAISDGDMFLMSCDPRLKTVQDYTADDRIAMTGLKTSTYAIVLQMEAAKVFGWDNRNKFDNISVPMSDPDGLGTLLSCRTQVKSQMTILPQSTMELASGHAHVVLSSQQVLGHPYVFDAAFTSTKFKTNNPKIYQAVVLGLNDAIDFIQKNPDKAADIYLKAEPFIGTRDTLIKLIKGDTPDHFIYTATPTATKSFLDFLYKSGTIKMRAQSWKDVWFDNVWSSQGS